MIELADNYGKGPVSLKSIEKNQYISWRYLQQLMPSLKKEGLVRVVKGNKGGYLLTRHPSSISIGEIIRAQKGSISFVECVENEEVCDYVERCPSRDIWIESGKILEKYFDSLSLENVCKKWRKKLKSI
jgi:Rrf2 family protein